MGWWETSFGAMGDEAADLVAEALRAWVAGRSSLTLAEVLRALEDALSALAPDVVVDGKEGYVEAVPVVSLPDVGAPTLQVEMEQLLETLVAIWRRDLERAPRAAELVDAFAFVLLGDIRVRLPDEPSLELHALQWRRKPPAPTRTLADLMEDVAHSGVASTVGARLGPAELRALLAAPGLHTLEVGAETLEQDAWPVLEEAQRLSALFIDRPPPEAELWRWLGRLTTLETLALPAAVLGPRTVDALARLTNLCQLDLHEADLADEDGARLAFPRLQVFKGAGTPLGDETALTLALESPLREVDMERTRLSDVGLAALIKVPTLTRLEVARSEASGPGLSILADLPGLRQVSVGGPEVAPAALGVFRELPALEALTLFGATAEHVRALAGCAGLRVLRLPELQGGADIGAALAAQSNLHRLELGGPDVDDDLVASLPQLPRLTSLSLACTAVTDQTLEQVAGWPALRVVDVGFTDVTEDGLARLAAIRPDLEVRT